MLFKNQDQIIKNGQTPELKKIRKDVLSILSSTLDSVNPYSVVKSKFYDSTLKIDSEVLDFSNFKNVYLIGFGKASVGMAQAVCDSARVDGGIVITNDPSSKVRSNKVCTLFGAHPIPDKKSIENTDRVLDVLDKCRENDLLIVLISGGGSALLCKPKADLADFQKTIKLLLKIGAEIGEINTVRKHLSLVKGGQLAKYAKCKVISLIISDVVGDPIESIASGPIYPDPTTYLDAKKILEKYGILTELPPSIRKVINDGIAEKIPETPKENDPIFNNISNFIIANNKIACEAACKKAQELGYKTMLLTTYLKGEAREIGKFLAEKAMNYTGTERSMAFVSGGETTVTIKGNGKGGRNLELVLGGVEVLSEKDVVLASFATDGIDGNCDASGAIADSFTFYKGQSRDLHPNTLLKNNNSYEFFKNLEDLLFTGPTGTNVMDIQILIKIV